MAALPRPVLRSLSSHPSPEEGLMVQLLGEPLRYAVSVQGLGALLDVVKLPVWWGPGPPANIVALRPSWCAPTVLMGSEVEEEFVPVFGQLLAELTAGCTLPARVVVTRDDGLNPPPRDPDWVAGARGEEALLEEMALLVIAACLGPAARAEDSVLVEVRDGTGQPARSKYFAATAELRRVSWRGELRAGSA